MEFARLPRFKRALAVAAIELTERDRQIIRLIHEHRFLRSSHICSLVSGSGQQILRRLKVLYHHGYLERPRCQLDYYHNGGSHSMVYSLGKKGASILSKEMGSDTRMLLWDMKNTAIGRVFLKHTLFVSDVMVAIELACRDNGIRFVSERELAAAHHEAGKRQRFQWKIKINGHQFGVFPDRVFALETTAETGERNRVHFFLEADRGTMPVIRKNFSQTSFYRKLLAYEATWAQGIHLKRFGFNRFRVLTVTTSADRVKSLVEACAKLKSGHGTFLFADKTILKGVDILSSNWQTSTRMAAATLLN